MTGHFEPSKFKTKARRSSIPLNEILSHESEEIDSLLDGGLSNNGIAVPQVTDYRDSNAVGRKEAMKRKGM